jgi:acyl-CoA thioesterase I
LASLVVTNLPRITFAHWMSKSFAVGAFTAAVTFPFALYAESVAPSCDAPFSMIRFTNPLSRVATKLKNDQPITIVAIGSSSTAGVGASSETSTYPSRLTIELTQRFPDHPITVLNRGVGGEDVRDMLKRFDTDVIAANPDLVLWQFGTNLVIRNDKLTGDEPAIREGLAKIRTIGADIVLIDPQFAPKEIEKPDAAHMVALIASTAKHNDINRFPRFDIMKRWHDIDHMDFKTFLSPDELHMNDWSYSCFAKALSVAISEAAQRPMVSAIAVPQVVR